MYSYTTYSTIFKNQQDSFWMCYAIYCHRKMSGIAKSRNHRLSLKWFFQKSSSASIILEKVLGNRCSELGEISRNSFYNTIVNLNGYTSIQLLLHIFKLWNKICCFIFLNFVIGCKLAVSQIYPKLIKCNSMSSWILINYTKMIWY